MEISSVRSGWMLVTILGVVGLCGTLAAQEEASSKPESSATTRSMTVVVSAQLGSHWLGIMAVPVDEGLRSHLKVGERIIVQQTVPDSPAAKAGIQQYDILLRLGDQEIHSLQDLLQAVEKNADKEASLTVLREGKEQSLTIKPEKRSAGDPPLGAIPEVQQLEDKVSRWLQEKGGVWRPDQSMKMRFFGPGFLHSGGKFPSELSVSISKEGDKPAKITVQRKEEKWEVTEDSLDKLPADVRPHIERLLGRGDMLFHVAPGTTATPPKAPLHILTPDAARKSIELQIHDNAGVEELRKAVDELRKELNQLKEQSKDSISGKKSEN